MWALGIILFQLVASYNHPFPFDNVFAMAIAIKDKDPDLTLLPPTVSPFIKEIINELLIKNPKNRPDAKSILCKDQIQIYLKRIIS
jgi:serine/threonine protein kinase